MLHIGVYGVRASGLGLVIGLVLCDGALRAMRSVLSRVGVYDVATIRLVVLMLGVTFLAATIPTLRVAGIELAEMLREKYNALR